MTHAQSRGTPPAASSSDPDHRRRGRCAGCWGSRLFTSDLIQVGALRQYPDSPQWKGEHDTGPGISLGFPQRPMEYQRDAHAWVVGSPNTVFLNDPHSRYQRRRIDPAGEYTEWLRYDLDAALDVIREHDPAAAENRVRVARTSLAPRNPGLFRIQHQLHCYLKGPQPDALFVEEVAFWILDQAVRSSLAIDRPSREGARTGRGRETTDEAHRTVSLDAIRHIVRNSSRNLGAAEIARAAHVSRPTLFRAFRAHTGMTVHGYLTSLRLRQAYLRLDDASVTIADLAADLGFSSHAHLTSVFQREFGTTPSAVRHERSQDLRRAEIESFLAFRGLPFSAD